MTKLDKKIETKIKEFLRYIFAPRIIIHQYGNMSQADMNKAQKAFKKMDKTFEKMDELYKEMINNHAN